MFIPEDAKVLVTFPAEFKATYSNTLKGDKTQFPTEIAVVIPGPTGTFTDDPVIHIAQHDGQSAYPQVVALSKADAGTVIAALQAGIAEI